MNSSSSRSSRRNFLRTASCGFGSLALHAMLQHRGAASPVSSAVGNGPLATKPPHFTPRAKRVIFLFMSGGPSQMDLFDYKPFETWHEEGARDTYALAEERVEQQLATYQQPYLDPAILASLEKYVSDKKANMPDAFV